MDAPPDPRKTNPPDPDCLAAEGQGGGDQRLDHRLGRYGRAKARSHQMAGYLSRHHREEKHLAKKLYECGSHLHFREWLAHDNRQTLHRGFFCQKPLLCPLCAIRRGGKLLRRYSERASFLLRTHDAFMVTLTVKNGPDLWERWTHLRGSLRRLRNRAKKGYGALSGCQGYLGSFEFTKSALGWHPHVHMVWFMPKGQLVAGGAGSQLSADWHAITGDSFIVDARPLYGDVTAAFCEVLKYALKFSSLDLADNLNAYFTLKGKRLITSGGCMWGLELPEDAQLEDDPLDGPFIELIYAYAGSQGYKLADSWIGHACAPVQVPVESPDRTTGDSHGGSENGVTQGQLDARNLRTAEAAG